MCTITTEDPRSPEAVCFGKSLVFQPPLITLQPPSLSDLPELMAFEFENRNYFEQRINARPASYYSRVGVEAAIQQAIDDSSKDKTYQFLVRDTSGQLVGRVNLTRIRRDHFHSADLGYRVAEAHTGKGVAKQSVKSVLEIAFRTLDLQRVEAVTTTSNLGSLAVLKFNGFEQFGLSQQSFELGGVWHDSLHFDCRRNR
jgi:ribosomal-protein-alanine N-acetyltransferase